MPKGDYTFHDNKLARRLVGHDDPNRQISRLNSEFKIFYMLDIYGDLKVLMETPDSIVEKSKRLKPAQFYRIDGRLVLSLPIGHETANSNVAGEENSYLISRSHDAGDMSKPGCSADHISTTPYYSARILSLMKQRTEYVTAPEVEFDIEASKSTWTHLDDSNYANQATSDDDHNIDDDWSDEDEGTSNQEEFSRLKEHPEWGPFFNRYSDFKRGDLLAKGGQAEVYEATGTEVDVRPDSNTGRFVMKVFNPGFRLRDLQKWWPKGLVEAANAEHFLVNVPYVCWAIGAQLLEDNSFAFVFPMVNCDLRKRIDAAMLKRNGGGPPFSPFTCFCIISDIAAGMAYLHNRDLLHHDLKAANVLDRMNVCEDQTCIMMLVADFESSVGIAGTGFWRAPEILSQVRDRKPIEFTKEADVYSFAMTCYEVLTGHLPFEGRSVTDVDGVIDRCERPKLPSWTCPELRDLVCRCWSSDPRERPTFDTIRADLVKLGQAQSNAWNINLRYKLLDYFNDELEDWGGETSQKPVENIGWEWPIYNQWRSIRGVEHRRRWKKTEDNWEDDAPFEVTYEQHGSMPDLVTVKLLSPHLIEVAKKCLPSQQQFSMEKPKIDARDMFIALQSLKDAHQFVMEDVNASEAQKWHLKHLLRFLQSHFKDTTVQVDRMRREKKVSFDLLWAFLYKGEKVRYRCPMTGQKLQAIVTLAYYKIGRSGKKFKGDIEYRVYNGRKYVKDLLKFRFRDFKSEQGFDSEETFDSIGKSICPMRLLEQSQVAELEDMFLRNGRNFYNIVAQGSTYMHYEGPRIRKEYVNGGYEIKKEKADGRVMVDLLSFARTNPGYLLPKQEKPPTTRHAQVVPCSDQEMPSDEELMLAPAVVYGFSFATKQWGGFDVNGLSEIHFDDQAYDRDLMLTDPDRKEMLLALATQYLKDPSAVDNMVPKIDPISNKGDGCIFLCYGPPGTGKTLTAECIAEKLHRPLWSMSVYELGVTARDLETNLMMILDIASQWRAVLLLDEADLYLEKRTSNAKPDRIAMTAIFLRLLEYYRGVLFLTTNRVASFDDAFCSRISMCLRYRPLSCAQREAVWRNLLSRAQIQNPDLTRFSDLQLNGREIRNCIRIAQVLALSSGEELTTSHVLRVVRMPVELRQNLGNAIMEETGDRATTQVLGNVN